MPQILATVNDKLSVYLETIGSMIETVPGGAILLRYIKSSHKNDPIRTVLEILLLIFAFKYFTASKYEVKKKDFVNLGANEIDELVDDWSPEPLVPAVGEQEAWKLAKIPVVHSAISTKVCLADHPDKELVNFASNNFLNLGLNEKVIEGAAEVIRNNGVGACGPPNFYGNQDIHIELEYDLADFFQTKSAVLYGQDFATAGSVVPSFVKRGDTIVVDAGINLAIQKALQISRANIHYYNHNDLEHLEEILIDLKENYFYNEKPISRKFIVTEGLFEKTGDFSDLSKIVELKEKYKFRLFLDESLSLGVLGKTGRGLAEHYNIPRTKIDITIGSMANSLGSSGAFCVGDEVMGIHQRIGSLAYCFSASLPPYVARASSVSLSLINELNSKKESKLTKKLNDNSIYLNSLVKKDTKVNSFFTIISHELSPILHLRIKDELRIEKFKFPNSYTGKGSIIEFKNKKGQSDKFIKELNEEEQILQKIIDSCVSEGVLITRSIYSIEQENTPLIPHLKICMNVEFSKKEIESAYKVISNSISKVFNDL